MKREVSRRELMKLALATPAVGLLGCDDEGAVLPNIRGSFAAIAYTQRIGEWVLDEWSGSTSRRSLWQAAFGGLPSSGRVDAGPLELERRFQQRVRADFESERTLLAKGWLLSRSEAALFAYLRLSYPVESLVRDSPPQPAAAPGAGELIARGARLYQRAGCMACHDLRQDKPTGPALAVATPAKLADGRSVARDEAYLRKALLDPAADVVEGYTPSMPKPDLGDDEVDALVAYLRSLPRE